jgi:peroxiredoxin Q/BCP
MTKLAVGDSAPNFVLSDQNGQTHSLSDYRGKWFLIYFYPKDDTAGCTKEACSFRDNLLKFQKIRITVIGISTNSAKSHSKFATKYALPFTLLADDKKEAVKAYGVLASKTASRTSFLIDADSRIVRIYENVQPQKHADQVLDDIKAMTNDL